MDQKRKEEFSHFIQKTALQMERFPEINRITLTRKGAENQPEAPAKQPEAPISQARPQVQGDLTTQQIAEILYNSQK